jgi:phosphoribosylformimino-5-aminoimidazole carboxamide ribotide isomerase
MAHRLMIIPAIDLMDGNCVRLSQGRKTEKTIYSKDPVGVAKRWEAAGAETIHIVDLDGAFMGAPQNLDVLKKIRQSIKARIQFGGGLRNPDSVTKVIDLGIDRVVLGTKAYESPGFLQSLISQYGEKIAVGIDAREGKVALKGWQELEADDPISYARRVVSSGVSTIIYTDIRRDGMLTGPNLAGIDTLARQVSCNVIASGGISSYDDVVAIARLNRPNIAGLIIGKALYSGKIRLEEAISAIDNL